MKSIKHVLWRGALALGLMAVGIGSGVGMPPIEHTAAEGDCRLETRILHADATGHHKATYALIVLRRPRNPAG